MKVKKINIDEISGGLIGEIGQMMADGYRNHPMPRKVTFNGFLSGLKIFLGTKAGAMWILVTPSGEFAGALMGCISPDPLNDDLIATEIMWRVNDRGRGYGNLLYNAFEEWAKEKGANKIFMGALADNNINKLSHFYGRKKFKWHSCQYVKEL